MKITNHWVTPIAEFDLALPQPMRLEQAQHSFFLSTT
jgi:hypothetical protein